MRSRETWRLFVLAASLTLNIAFFGHDVLHDPFIEGLGIGLGLFGGLLLPRYVDGTRRRQNTAEQQPSSAEERDASGG
jgi:hypothetical protein